MKTHNSSCSDPAWNLVRPRSWFWKIHFRTKKQSQKWQDWSSVHFIVRWNWNILKSADCCLSQQQKACESIKIWFQFLYSNLSWVQYSVLLPNCLQNMTLIPLVHVVCDYSFKSAHTCAATSYDFVRFFCDGSEAILSCISGLWPGCQTFLWERNLKELKHEIILAKKLFWKESKLPISLEQVFSFIATLLETLRLIVTGRCNSSRHERFMRGRFFTNEISENNSQKFHGQWKFGWHWSTFSWQVRVEK